MSTIYDVVVVGAGPAGSSAGYYLASRGLKVLLLDKFAFPRDKTCGDALTPRALRILDEMEILDDLLQVGHSANAVEFIAPKGHAALAPLPRHDRPSDRLLFVPRLLLDNIILERAQAVGAQFQGPVHVTDIQRDGQEMVVTGEHRRQTFSFRSRMVIVAIGANVKLLMRMQLLKKTPQVMLSARAYFEGVSTISDRAQCRFDGVPLPGYGWAFPLADSRANVGVGLFRAGLASLWMPKTAQIAFGTFLKTPAVQTLLSNARQVGPLKGYPLRADFAHSPTFGDGVLLAGEAAGLVNPVTGEGIDYALESGKMAAEHLLDMFAADDLSLTRLRLYDQHLRQRYQRLFVLCDRLRLLYLNPFFLNRVIKTAASNDELMKLYMNIVIENQDVYAGVAPKTLSKVLLGSRKSSPSA
ncbi:MAG: geranylgeranyl reductase family protein [Ktedonobacteraceae bacterium]|nr:geranylgeranyl reductase family protein [Ktedonobacteraceae bacterium]